MKPSEIHVSDEHAAECEKIADRLRMAIRSVGETKDDDSVTVALMGVLYETMRAKSSNPIDIIGPYVLSVMELSFQIPNVDDTPKVAAEFCRLLAAALEAKIGT